MTRLATLALCLLGAAAGAQELDAKAILDEAISAIEWDIEKNWAFTSSSLQDEKLWVAHHDPRRPDGERWTLQSVDGRPPSDDEQREFRKQKSAQQPPQEDNNRLSASIGDSELTLVKETETHWSFGFNPDLDNDTLSESVDAVVHIAKSGPYVELLEIRNRDDIKAGFGTRLSTFQMYLAFAPIAGDGPVVPETVNINVAGRAFLMIPFNEHELIRYSDFEYAGDP